MTDEATPEQIRRYKPKRRRDEEKVGDDVMNIYYLKWLDCLYREAGKKKIASILYTRILSMDWRSAH
jgi:archaellum component FlaD/FlaE